MTPGSSRVDSDWLTLCDLIVSGAADDEQFAQFERRLSDEPSLAESYLNYAALSVDLLHVSCRAPAADLAQVLINGGVSRSTDTPSAAWRRYSLPVFFLAASLLALAFFFNPWPAGDIDAQQRWAPTVALIGDGEEVVWKSGQELEVGMLLKLGQQVEIESGYLEIEFGQGAVVVLEGPASLTATSPNAGVLTAGRLAAIVPPWAHGFRIDTPSLKLIDRGTQFAVAVNKDNEVDLVVTKGEVEASHGAEGQDTSDTRLITAGCGLRSNHTGVEATEGDEQLAVLTEQLPERPDETQVEFVGGYWRDFVAGAPDQPRRSGAWRYYTNAIGPIGDPANYTELLWDPASVGWYDANGSIRDQAPTPLAAVKLRPDGGHPGHGSRQAADGIDRYAIAAFTVPTAGVYHIDSGWIVRPENRPELAGQGVDLLVHVDNAPPILQLDCDKDRFLRFRQKLGELPAGATVYVAAGPNGINFNDRFEWGFVIARELSSDNEL